MPPSSEGPRAAEGEPNSPPLRRVNDAPSKERREGSATPDSGSRPFTACKPPNAPPPPPRSATAATAGPPPPFSREMPFPYPDATSASGVGPPAPNPYGGGCCRGTCACAPCAPKEIGRAWPNGETFTYVASSELPPRSDPEPDPDPELSFAELELDPWLVPVEPFESLWRADDWEPPPEEVSIGTCALTADTAPRPTPNALA